MSTDLRERLQQAASTPTAPLDVDEVYRRGRHIRGVRMLSGVAVVVAASVALGALAVTQRSSVPLPAIGSVAEIEDVFADGRVSWREYRVAAGATADCLQAAGADRSHRFDQARGTFTFEAADTRETTACRERHLARVENAWVTAITTDQGGVTWDEYRAAYEGLAVCLQDAGLGSGGDFDLAQGFWSSGYTVRADAPASQADAAEQTFEDCRRANDIPALQRAWDKLTAQSEAEQHATYELAAQCMRERGHDVPDADPDTLSAAIAQWPDDYDRCLEAGRAAAQPYLGGDVDPDLPGQLAAAQARWDQADLDTYTYQLDDAILTRSVTVQVVEGQKPSGSDGFTIDELFSNLRDSIDTGDALEVSFHPELGHPTRIRVVRDEASGAMVDLTISDVEPTEDTGAGPS